MQICRDICNRYKHYTLSSPSLDGEFSIQRRLVDPFRGDEWEWTVIADKHNLTLWDLMMRCIDFWEALVAAHGLSIDDKVDWESYRD